MWKKLPASILVPGTGKRGRDRDDVLVQAAKTNYNRLDGS